MNSIEPADRLALTPEMLWDIEHYKEEGLYFYLEATQELLPNGRVNVNRPNCALICISQMLAVLKISVLAGS